MQQRERTARTRRPIYKITIKTIRHSRSSQTTKKTPPKEQESPKTAEQRQNNGEEEHNRSTLDDSTCPLTITTAETRHSD